MPIILLHAIWLEVDYKLVFDHKAKAQGQCGETNSTIRMPKLQPQQLSESTENTCFATALVAVIKRKSIPPMGNATSAPRFNQCFPRKTALIKDINPSSDLHKH